MIKLCTQVNPEGFEKRLRLEDDITLLGSCFVDNISAKLRDASFHVHANPFGTLYNPASIANAVRLLDSQDVPRRVRADGRRERKNLLVPSSHLLREGKRGGILGQCQSSTAAGAGELA